MNSFSSTSEATKISLEEALSSINFECPRIVPFNITSIRPFFKSNKDGFSNNATAKTSCKLQVLRTETAKPNNEAIIFVFNVVLLSYVNF